MQAQIWYRRCQQQHRREVCHDVNMCILKMPEVLSAAEPTKLAETFLAVSVAMRWQCTTTLGLLRQVDEALHILVYSLVWPLKQDLL